MPQQGIDYMMGNTRVRDLGAVPFSEDEDPSFVRNPYYMDLQNANSDMRQRRASADLMEDQADPFNDDRARTNRIYDQQQADQDQEQHGMERARRASAIDRMSQESAAEGYFDTNRTAMRNSEFERKQQLYDQQYGSSAGAKEYAADRGAESRVKSAEIAGDARTGAARLGAGARVRGQMVNPDTNVVNPESAPAAGQIEHMITGKAGSKPFPRQLLEQYAHEHGYPDAGAAEDDLNSRGWVVVDGN